MDGIVKLFIAGLLLGTGHYVFFMSATSSILIGMSFLLLVSYLGKPNTEKLIPPGPPRYPIIGSLKIIFARHFYEYCDEQHKKYGNIISFPFGNVPFISVNDYDIIKELSGHPNLQFRPRNPNFVNENFTMGIINSEGSVWKHQRRFLIHSLRDSGMGKLRMQYKIRHELERLIESMEKSRGEPIGLQLLLEKSTANIICALAFNKEFNYEDKELIQAITALNDNLKLSGLMGVFAVFSFLKPLMGLIVNKMNANYDKVKSMSQNFIEGHKKTLDAESPRDLLDLYLLEINRTVEDDASDCGYHETFFEGQLKHVIVDIFSAGTETTSTTILWALLYMINYPDIQDKVRKELDEVIGSERFPRIEDKPYLPFTTATLQEVERLGSIVPQALPRTSTEPFKYKNFVFPTRSFIMFNLYSVHRDPKLWNNPLEFNPSRFIDFEGKAFRPPQLSPFGNGKRACAGEALARMEIFIYFATLIQNFIFESPVKGSPPPLSAIRSFIRSPGNYSIRCIRRNFN